LEVGYFSGKITYGNELFIRISGYAEQELLGSPHNILRHQDMPSSVFKLLWTNIALGKEVFAYVKNRTKNNDYYWVYAHVTPSFNSNGQIIGYHSVRRKPKGGAITAIEDIYRHLLSSEKSGGVNAGTKMLEDILKKGGENYDEFIFSL